MPVAAVARSTGKQTSLIRCIRAAQNTRKIRVHYKVPIQNVGVVLWPSRLLFGEKLRSQTTPAYSRR